MGANTIYIVICDYPYYLITNHSIGNSCGSLITVFQQTGMVEVLQAWRNNRAKFP